MYTDPAAEITPQAPTLIEIVKDWAYVPYVLLTIFGIVLLVSLIVEIRTKREEKKYNTSTKSNSNENEDDDHSFQMPTSGWPTPYDE